MSKIQVRDWQRGEVAFLPVQGHDRVVEVAYIRRSHDGPWVVTGSGLNQQSFCVTPDTALFTERDEAVAQLAEDQKRHAAYGPH